MGTRQNISLSVVAIIWAAVIFATAIVLRGTPYASTVLTIQGGGVAVSIILLGGIAGRASRAE